MPAPAPPVTIHDWTRVLPGIWHDFHVGWIGEIRKQLNGGLLPDPFYALAEPQGGFTVEADPPEDGEDDDGEGDRRFEGDLLSLHGGGDFGGDGGVALAEAPPRVRLRLPAGSGPTARRITVRHATGDRIVALIELVSPGNRDGRRKIEAFCDQVEAAVDGGVHVLLVDLFPPTELLPAGMQGAVAERFDIRYEPPPGEPLCCAAYRSAGEATTSFVEPLAVGAAPPTMPLFLTADRYVNLPLAASYAAAFSPTPAKFRRMLEGPSETGG